MRLAVDRLREVALPDPTILRGRFKVGDIDEASGLLEGTYIVRLFAEFETALRSFWATLRDTHPMTEQLLDSLASTQRVPYDDLKNAHKARDFRNGLVHERADQVEPIPIATFRRYLLLYPHHLPPRWA
ncbi:MAG: hypothetical protein JO339_38760 [Alphaproteobacteria bacterium]|nr:hypothetical protein [Alphaproteobacteria bacterium]